MVSSSPQQQESLALMKSIYAKMQEMARELQQYVQKNLESSLRDNKNSKIIKSQSELKSLVKS